MRDEDQSHPSRLVQVEQEVDDLFAIDAVEIAGRFVGKERCRSVDDAPRDGNALALATGELVR